MYLQRQLTYDFGFLVFITLGLTLIQVWGGKSEQLEWKSGILELIPWPSLYPMDSHGAIVYSFLLVSCPHVVILEIRWFIFIMYFWLLVILIFFFKKIVSCIPYPSHYSHGLFHDIPMWSPCESTSSLSPAYQWQARHQGFGLGIPKWSRHGFSKYESGLMTWFFFWGGYFRTLPYHWIWRIFGAILGHFHIIHRIWMDSTYFCWEGVLNIHLNMAQRFGRNLGRNLGALEHRQQPQQFGIVSLVQKLLRSKRVATCGCLESWLKVG